MVTPLTMFRWMMSWYPPSSVLMKNKLASKDTNNTMHQANEFADVEDLYRAAAIYAEAIYELIK